MGSKPVGISASRGAAILGENKYSDPVEAWLKIMEQRCEGFCETNLYPHPEFVDNAATQWGNALENSIINLALRESDFKKNQASSMCDMEKFYSHHEREYITCHIDGRYGGTKTIHEGKTTNQRTFRADWGKSGTDHIPRGYMIQVQHQMMLTGADECIVSVLVLPKMQTELPDVDELLPEWINNIAESLYTMGYFHQYPVKRNQRLIDLMLKKYVDFWENNVLKKIPPRSQSTDWVKKMIPKPCGTIIANTQIERWSTEISGIQKEIKTGKERVADLKTEILWYMKTESEKEGVCIDEESTERLILLSGNGYKMHSYNGKTFR